MTYRGMPDGMRRTWKRQWFALAGHPVDSSRKNRKWGVGAHFAAGMAWVFLLLFVLPMFFQLLLHLTGGFDVRAAYASETEQAGASFELHLLDVGQGQCVLIKADGHFMLIDGGGRDSSSFVVSYLKQQGIEAFDTVAVSHYDEDHISGVIGVLHTFPVEALALPDYPGAGELYDSMSAAAVSNGATIEHAQAGWTCSIGEAFAEVVGPVREDYEIENDRSLVFRITYGDKAFLISGDAEVQSEQDMADSGADLSADVYVAGHHGSASSSSDCFLDAVSPSYVLVSCGLGNSYGHPTEDMLQRVQNRGIDMFRTDLQGTVIAYSDGSSLEFNTKPTQDWTPGTLMSTVPGDETPDAVVGAAAATAGAAALAGGDVDGAQKDTETSAGITYVCNTNTKKFHRPGCHSVDQIKAENRVDTTKSKEELIADGYAPCGNCHP